MRAGAGAVPVPGREECAADPAKVMEELMSTKNGARRAAKRADDAPASEERSALRARLERGEELRLLIGQAVARQFMLRMSPYNDPPRVIPKSVIRRIRREEIAKSVSEHEVPRNEVRKDLKLAEAVDELDTHCGRKAVE